MPSCTIAAVIREQAATRGEARALIFGDRESSYALLDRRTDRIAQALIGAGLKPGDRIAYLGKNSDRHYELLIGASKARVILVPFNWRLTAAELEYLVADSTPSLLFCGPEFGDMASALARGTSIAKVIAVEDAEPGRRAFSAWLSGAPDTAPDIVPKPDDIAVIMYTSGTTGKPKGAMLSHRSLLRVVDGRPTPEPDFFVWRPGDVALIAMPTFHVGGTGQGLRSLKGGATALILKEFAVDQLLEAVLRYRVDKIFLVPSAIHAVLQHPSVGSADYSCLRYILYGAAPIAPDLLHAAIAAFGCGFIQMYGSTETSGTITVLSPEDHVSGDAKRLTTAGIPLPGVELMILDETGAPAAQGEAGEIAVRSAANMVGYWNRPGETAQTIDADNWLRTGDIGRIDEDGYLSVFDRAKDMIISGGENVYPAEVENAIFGHPAVAEVAVVGVAHPRWGEAVTAAVVPQPGMAVDGDDIMAWARERIAAYKIPKTVHLVDALPRNSSGKVLRRELRARFSAGSARA